MACVLSSLLSVTDAHEIFSAPSRAHLFAPWQPDGHWYAVNARRITPPALALFFPSVIFLWVCFSRLSSPLHFVTSPLRTVDETTDREQMDWSVAWTEHSPHGSTLLNVCWKWFSGEKAVRKSYWCTPNKILRHRHVHVLHVYASTHLMVSMDVIYCKWNVSMC